MTIGELITFYLITNGVDYHKELRPDIWRIRLISDKNIITFLYHKNPANNALTFLNGRVSTSQGDLGTVSEEIWDFDELLKVI